MIDWGLVDPEAWTFFQSKLVTMSFFALKSPLTASDRIERRRLMLCRFAISRHPVRDHCLIGRADQLSLPILRFPPGRAGQPLVAARRTGYAGWQAAGGH